MRTIDIARKLAELNQKEDAQKAYIITLNEVEGKNPDEELEAASYIFFSEGDHRIALTTFISLYNRGYFQTELMDLMTQAFYLPNKKSQEKRYERNCTVLKRYPYFFCKNKFPAFEELPIRFFPFSEEGFVPFYCSENRFGTYVNFNDAVIDRYFFRDLEKPILAADVYSQYQLEYLNDNVRKSEWIGRENHIYLHYTDWLIFCAYLQCLEYKELLQENKLVLLIENEIEQYPIDFKERFGIDYSKYPVRPVGIREVNRLIWHTQLSTHNGGDFFNEIFYGHPNLLAYESIYFSKIKEKIHEIKEVLKIKDGHFLDPELRKLEILRNPTEKDCLVAYFLMLNREHQSGLRDDARIAPALFFQPHFSNVEYDLEYDSKTKNTILKSDEYDKIQSSPIFHDFKYIKTVTPIRRITSSYGATVRFMVNAAAEGQAEGTKTQVPDELSSRLLNRSYLVDIQNRLYRDSILVRFEDGKLNPKATFTALAEFLDIPYTESMTYCSGTPGINPESMEGNVRGFDLTSVYRTYDNYVDDADRAILEYFTRDAYEKYGYDFHYYHRETVDETWLQNKISEISHLNQEIRESLISSIMMKENMTEKKGKDSPAQLLSEEDQLKLAQDIAEEMIQRHTERRLHITSVLLNGLRFVNKNGQPLHMMKLLQLDPALLEQPLYH